MSLKVFCLLSGFLFIVGCQKFSVAPAESPESNLHQGTGDGGGGGNGVGNRVYESYIVNPLELPAYKKYVGPIFKKLKEQAPDKKNEIDYEILATIKTWYIAPIKFKPLDKETIGLVFSDDQTQQLARQTRAEIWLDSKYFDVMSDEEQAKLILHEIVMNLYLLKYKKFSELCKVLNTLTKAKTPCADDIDEIFLPVKESPLIIDDYYNIRAMTGWIWLNRSDLSREETFLQFLRHNFDHRLFEKFYETSGPGEKPPEFPTKDAIEILDRALLLNKAPELCKGLTTNIQYPCKMNIVPFNFSAGPVKIDGVTLSAQNKMGQTLFETNIPVNTMTSMLGIKDLFTREPLSLVPLISSRAISPVKGSKYRWNFLILKKNSTRKDEMDLHAILSVPVVITKIEEKDGYKVCHGDKPKAETFENDMIVATYPGVDTAFLKWLGNNMKMSVLCWFSGQLQPTY